jgi:hypothetical protein
MSSKYSKQKVPFFKKGNVSAPTLRLKLNLKGGCHSKGFEKLVEKLGSDLHQMGPHFIQIFMLEPHISEFLRNYVVNN